MSPESSQGYYPSMALLPEFQVYGNFLHDHKMLPQSQASSPTSVNFQWHTAAPPRSKSSTNQHNVPQASSSMNSDPGPLSFLPSDGSLRPSDTISRGQQSQASAAASNGYASSQEVYLTEAERAAASDEKRRKNTAASGKTLLF